MTLRIVVVVTQVMSGNFGRGSALVARRLSADTTSAYIWPGWSVGLDIISQSPIKCDLEINF